MIRTCKHCATSLLAISASFGLAHASFGQEISDFYPEHSKLHGLGSASVDDKFGGSVAISGDYSVIGVPKDNDSGNDSGSAYVYERNGAGDWIEVQKLTGSNGAAGDLFGWSVAISGETAVVGAKNDAVSSFNSGSAYVFERDEAGNWTEVQKLTASDGAENDYFGVSVAISGETVVVGAYGDDDNGTDSGSAYVFERDGAGNWFETAKLTASDGSEYDWFGRSVSISGDRVVVGADLDDDNGYESGSAYVFERNGAGNWIEIEKLLASDGEEWDLFGSSVAISGETVVVGAMEADTFNGNAAGSAYVFERNGSGDWIEIEELVPSNGASWNYFGKSVAISGDALVVGAYFDDDNGTNSGSAYVFERNGAGNWIEIETLVASDAAAWDYFGKSVAISGDRVVVGADGDDDSVSNSGSAYVFERNESGDWAEAKKLLASDGSGGDRFGLSVAISGDHVVIGAPYHNPYNNNGDYYGSAYMFDASSVINLHPNVDQPYLTLQTAISEAISGADLAIRSKAFDVNGIINTTTLPFEFIAVEPIEMGEDLMFLPATGTSFIDSEDVDDAGYSLKGQLIAPEQGELSFSSLKLLAGSQFQHNESLLLINEEFMTIGGTAFLSGDVLAASAYTGTVGTNRVVGDTNMFCDYTNDGTTIIQQGTLYIYGDLLNNGTLTGEYNNGFAGGEGPEQGDGFYIDGRYSVGPGATLSMPDPAWWLRVGGDLDIAINDPSRFAMSEANVEFTGHAKGEIQTFEAMSSDLGASEVGFDSSNYPIGSLRVSGHSSVMLVNNHANSSDASCEVAYIDELVIDAGGYFSTGDCTIYARRATINGQVDNPESIVIVEEASPCLADLTGDGQVNGADLGLMIAAWGTSDGDLTDDGITNGADLGLLIAAWGLCN